MALTPEQWEERIGRRVRLRDLHVLLSVTQLGSMAKAAKALAVSQPAISKSIADLENALGVQLLDRGPSGVQATAYGAALVRRGLASFDELRQGVAEIQCLAGTLAGEVRVGCNDSLTVSLLPGAIEKLAEDHPGVGCKSPTPVAQYRRKSRNCVTETWMSLSGGDCSPRRIWTRKCFFMNDWSSLPERNLGGPVAVQSN